MGGSSALSKRTPQNRPDDTRYALKTSVPSRPALPTFSYWAHRGGASFAPEQSAAAYQICAALGADVLDGDVQVTADNAPVLMHDSTVDRTTNGTGNVSDFTILTLLQLNAAAKFPGWPTSTPPGLVTDLLNLYAARRYLSLEPKDATNAGVLMDLCDASGAAAAVVLNAHVPAVLTAAKARGYKFMYYWAPGVDGTRGDGVGGAGQTIAQAVAGGADYFSFDYQNQLYASLLDLVATGVPVMPSGVNRRVELAAIVAAGCKGVVSDNWYYLKAATAIATKDSWRSGLYGHGFNIGSGVLSGNEAAYTISGGGLVVAVGASVIPGELCPLANAAGSYTIDLDLGYLDDPTGSGTPATGIAFGQPDDSISFLGSATGATFTGWELYLRWAGGLTLFKYTSRTDTATVTSGSATVADASITTADAGRPVRGTGIPPNTFVGPAASITAGVSFKLSSSSIAQADVLARANGTSVQVGGIQTSVNGTQVTTPQMVAGTLAHGKVVVTSTTVTIARTDSACPTLSGALTSGTPINALPVNALPVAIASGQKLLLANGQVATASGSAALSATSIPISSLTPSSAVASGTVVGLAVQTTDSANRGGYLTVGSRAGLTSARKQYKNLTIT